MSRATEIVARVKALVDDAPEVTMQRTRYGYTIGGDFFRRVTTFTGGIPKPWLGNWAAKTVAEFAHSHQDEWTKLPKTDAVKLLKGSPWSKRDDAGDRGTAVHNAIEAYLKGEPIERDLTEDKAACVVAVHRFLEARQSTVLATELTVFNRTHGYAGTLDLWEVGADEFTWLCDWKTSSGVYVEHAVQQAAYRNAEFAIVQKKPIVGTGSSERWTGKVIPWGEHMAERLGIVHVKPHSAVLYPIRYTDRLWTVFRAAAHVKLWQLDTDDSFGKEPREQVYGEPLLEIEVEEVEA